MCCGNHSRTRWLCMPHRTLGIGCDSGSSRSRQLQDVNKAEKYLSSKLHECCEVPGTSCYLLTKNEFVPINHSSTLTTNKWLSDCAETDGEQWHDQVKMSCLTTKLFEDRGDKIFAAIFKAYKSCKIASLDRAPPCPRSETLMTIYLSKTT